jgi:thiol-disulfide isomerase/thioredoxin
MSTLRHPLRLLGTVATASLALAWVPGLAGCSATSGLRAGGPSRPKTFLSVGDKPLPVVTGEPGSTVAADGAAEPTAPRRRARADGRISGRVLDADGRPVPEARVRLAYGAASGGKVVKTTTDPSGAFTLHGLRPGTEYTVIAEWDNGDGALTGRASARTSETDVKISLAPTDAEPARSADRTRVDRVSDREPADEESAEGPVDPDGGRPNARGRLNEEDLPPPAEAEAMANPATTRAATSARHARRSPALKREEPETAPPSESNSGEALDDDVPNPLPPAIEPGAGQAAAKPFPATDLERFADAPPRLVAERDHDPIRERPTGRDASVALHAAPRSSDEPESQPRPETAPGSLVIVPETFGPVSAHEPEPLVPHAAAAALAAVRRPQPLPAPEPEPEPETIERTAASSPEVTDPFDTPAPAPLEGSAPERPAAASIASARRSVGSSRATEPTAEPDAPPRKRPTWGDVSALAERPAVESDAPRSRADLGAAEDTRVARANAAAGDEPSVPSCEYDERHRRIVDFRLTDPAGKPVRFRDLDADLVLIDFWGTWCGPCLKSIPHLVDLQERMGKRLLVVGIACEPDAPEKSAARVAAAAEKLKVNYPLLLSRNDGSCPLQEALHVQAFPTMVLVDRDGRVLWRDQGATPATLARLDRFLASATPR